MGHLGISTLFMWTGIYLPNGRLEPLFSKFDKNFSKFMKHQSLKFKITTYSTIYFLKTTETSWILILPNHFFQDPEVHKTKESIEFFTQLGNRYNISHVAQVKFLPNN